MRRKCDILKIVYKIIIPLRYKEIIIINLYSYNFNCRYMRSNSEIHWGKQWLDIAHVLHIIVLFWKQFCLQSESSTTYLNRQIILIWYNSCEYSLILSGNNVPDLKLEVFTNKNSNINGCNNSSGDIYFPHVSNIVRYFLSCYLCPWSVEINL